MGFWGIEVKSSNPVEYKSDDVRGRVHVTQATLGTGSSTKKSILQCTVQNKSPVFLCSLLPDKIESCSLNLEFEDDDIVTFSVLGPRSIHLSGIISTIEDYESDSFGEDIADTDTDESTEYDSEDGFDDGFIDDSDMEMYPPSPVPNSGVVIEEIVDDAKPTNESAHPKKLKSKKKSINSEEENSEKQIVGKSVTGVPVLESEDEDGFPLSASHKSDVNNGKSGAEQTDNKTAGNTTSLKRKVESVGEDGEPEMQKKKNKNKKKALEERKSHDAEIENADESVLRSNIDVDEKQKKKNKNKEKELVEGKSHDAEIENLDESGLKRNNDVDENSEKKKKKRKKKAKKGEDDTKIIQTVEKQTESKSTELTHTGTKDGSVTQVEKQTESKSCQVRTFANGLVVEELAMGKPDGKKAAPGKQIGVQYIGKLKKNGKIFDSNVGRAPFKFRVGVGAVIKGWDVGVTGMRVGDKRRLTIPPAMGYGAKGAGGAIPPNAWLMFDVELVDVR